MKVHQVNTKENDTWKVVRSDIYNYDFNKMNGFFARWGRTKEDDPPFSPLGPEILDCEISTICSGIDGKPCAHCYKSNTARGRNMSFETWKTILDKIPANLTQVAFGIGDIDGNPDLWKIMEYCRTNGRNYVVPNITINGWNLTDEYAENFARLCGAIAVSRYQPKDVCYDAVKKLTDLGMEQVNIHMLVAKETFKDCWELIKDMKSDPRLADMNAAVFLTLKQKGRGTWYHTVSLREYERLIKFADKMGVRYGMDSCSSYKFLNAVRDHPKFDHFKIIAEPCESGIFSSYINVDGMFYPCSFTEGSTFRDMDWTKGLSVAECDNFLRDIWYHPKTIQFRKFLIDSAKKNELGCRTCPAFKI